MRRGHAGLPKRRRRGRRLVQVLSFYIRQQLDGGPRLRGPQRPYSGQPPGPGHALTLEPGTRPPPSGGQVAAEDAGDKPPGTPTSGAAPAIELARTRPTSPISAAHPFATNFRPDSHHTSATLMFETSASRPWNRPSRKRPGLASSADIPSRTSIPAMSSETQSRVSSRFAGSAAANAFADDASTLPPLRPRQQGCDDR
jgi:hypothetical protein